MLVFEEFNFGYKSPHPFVQGSWEKTFLLENNIQQAPEQELGGHALCSLFSETGFHYVALVSLELAMLTRLALNS